MITFIDIDGTINPCNIISALQPIHPDIVQSNGMMVSPKIWENILQIPGEKRFLSTWCSFHEKISEELGRLNLTIDSTFRDNIWHLDEFQSVADWKAHCVLLTLETQPVILLDDDELLREEILERTDSDQLLIVTPNTDFGLMESDFDIIKKFTQKVES